MYPHTGRGVNVCECVWCLHVTVGLCSKANGSWDYKSDFVLITQPRCWGQIFSNKKVDLGQYYSNANFRLQWEFIVLLSVPCHSNLNVLVFRPVRVFLNIRSKASIVFLVIGGVEGRRGEEKRERCGSFCRVKG